MKLTKKIISFICVVAMMLSMTVVAPMSALEADETVSANWIPLAAKYSVDQGKIIAPSSAGFAVRTTGFTYNADAEGGLKVHSAAYDENKGVYSVAAVSSNNKTSLDGLSVTITPDDIKMLTDDAGASTNITVIFSTEQVKEIAGFNPTTKSYETGLNASLPVMSNGLRELCPEGAKSVAVTISNQQASNVEDHMATTVAIIYDDGVYTNSDGHTGFRWVFTARNYAAETGNGDNSGVVQKYERINFTDGLTVSFRADAEHGFIVSVNGKDYYEGDAIGYFPDCSEATFKGTSDEGSYALQEGDYIYGSDTYHKFEASMTYHRSDIDLTGVGAADVQGYVTIGATGTMNTKQACDFTIATINGYPAASWTGQDSCKHPDAKVEVTKEATCGDEGSQNVICNDCGAVVETQVIEATGDHTPAEEYTVTKAPTCVAKGEEVLYCTVCNQATDTKEIDVDPEAHAMDWVVVTEPTCTEKGVQQWACTNEGCDNVTDTVEEIDAKGHDHQWVVVTEPTCTADGVSENKCTVCGDVKEQRNDAKLPHNEDVQSPVVVDGNWTGAVQTYCSMCGELVGEDTVNIDEVVGAYTDVDKNAWYVGGIAYCTYKGYMSGTSATTAAPDATLTRAQFVTLLANLDGVDLAQYADVDNDFVDVNKGQWFYNAVTWAAAEGYANGVGGGQFAPDANVTRAQLAKFFYVYAEKNGGDMTPTNDLSDFSDGATVPGWAVDYIKWAVGAGLINGMGGAVNGDGTATRAQAAKIFMNFDNYLA